MNSNVSLDNNQLVNMKDIYAGRREKVRSLLDARGLDALLVSSPANRFYLSGFALHDTQLNESSGYLLICKDGRDWLLTDSRYDLAAQRLWDSKKIFIYSGDIVAVQKFLGSAASIIGLEPKGLSMDFAQKLQKHWEKIYVPSFVPVDGIVESLRVCKDQSEIDALHKSFSLNHALLSRLEEKITQKEVSRLTEKELAWQVERFFRENGAQELAFEAIIATGPNAALPHAEPEDIPVGENKPLLADVGCRVDNYCSDQTRTWWLGANPSEEFAKTLELVRKAQKSAMNQIRPGVICSDVYKAAWKVFEDAGVSKAFTHGLGHGVGLETHELPHLSLRSKEILKQGMVVTVEPGLYYSQWGGVRWENTVLVEKDGISVF